MQPYDLSLSVVTDTRWESNDENLLTVKYNLLTRLNHPKPKKYFRDAWLHLIHSQL